MQKLNLPQYSIHIKDIDGVKYIYDQIRQKYIKQTPEEFVRQSVVNYLINDKKVPKGLISVEHSFCIGNSKKYRADIVVFSKNMSVLLVVECKSPNVMISKDAMSQVLRYNSFFKSKRLFVTNGNTHFCVVTDDFANYCYDNNIPCYHDM